ncbi:MerR family transcriptional regulator [Sedimentibacter saalensis]|jgi:DNA-binding transcriptional MerR regulator|uniref:MerR family transcriptional regulator n=1 Tax=Sedimentibacter saalensis TaxID=130788 RepID=UPI00289AFF92|nr:MerR family transcriptional regulator [Sedimentibacter saalensis]
MEYTVKKLAVMANVSTRTLRYYDEIGILKPARINSSGYRLYGEHEVDRLQQILFYRELGVNLEQIKEIITSREFDEKKALEEHRQLLISKRTQLDILIHNVEKTILSKEGKYNMSNTEKFEGFKDELITNNEKKFGKEAREKYGEKAVDKSNKILKNMTEEQFKEIEDLGNEVLITLEKAFKEGKPYSETAQKAAELHGRWLSFFWGQYNKEAHVNITQMYIDDERFKAYYDSKNPGTAEFLREAVLIYTGMKK